MLLLAGTNTVRAEDAGPITVRAEEVKPRTAWAAAPLQGGLAATFATLQVLDVVSTVNAVSSGRGIEANPMVGGLVNHPAAFAAVKGAMTAATLVAMHRYSKKHPKAAVITMIAFNIGYSYIVSSNFRIASGR
jgi:hypothetical protein